MRFACIAVLLCALPAASFAANEAKPAKSSPQELQESFATLTLDFCVAVITRPEASMQDIANLLPQVAITGPKPLSDAAGKWTEPMKEQLRAQDDTPVYRAITPAAAVGAFHMAFARADGASCMVVAQDIPLAASVTNTRLAADNAYHVVDESEFVRIYGRPAEGARPGYIVVAPATSARKGIERVTVERFNVRIPVTDDRREAWVAGILRACFSSIAQRRAVTQADFGEFMEAKPAETGGVNFHATAGYPAAMLFANDAPKFGCLAMVAEGSNEGARVLSLLRAQLSNLSATRVRGAQDEELWTSELPDSAASGARVTIREIMFGNAQSITIETR